MSLFFLNAYEKVPRDKISDYEQLSAFTDQKVQEIEPGMLVHVQTVHAETDQHVTYCWHEIYASYEDLRNHLDNKYVAKHIRKLNDGLLDGKVEVHIYCDWDEVQKDPFKETIPGLDLKFIEIKNGYFR